MLKTKLLMGRCLQQTCENLFDWQPLQQTSLKELTLKMVLITAAVKTFITAAVKTFITAVMKTFLTAVMKIFITAVVTIFITAVLPAITTAVVIVLWQLLYKV